MDNYLVSARKYRPATFQTVVGQGSLTATLKNAIQSGKLAHSYLFCGPRGVGKTTCARIFAKTINCENLTPDGEACGECESCKSFNEELRSYNVFELDAASNNSVEDIRLLTEQVRIPPMNGKYKVYVIDEVHMLSQAAFNAFLKTLEEPPHYAIFILATTEKHKIIPTILSRCQIYDFNRISNENIVAHLKEVAEKEGVEAEMEALGIIAEKSDGGMRDALSIFDQVVSFTRGKVTYAQTIANLNVLDYDYYFRFTDLFLEKKIPDALLLLNEIMENGFDPSHLISGLMLHFRNLLVSKDSCTLPLLNVSGSIRERYGNQASKCEAKFIYRVMRIFNECDLNYKTSKNKRLLVELSVIQAAQAVDEDDESSGRKPKRLKPIFNAVVTSQATTAKAVSTQVSSAPAANSTVDTTNGVVPNIKIEPKTTRQVAKKGRDAIFTSIYGNKKQETVATETVKAVVNENRQIRPLTDDLLQVHWMDYASQLPREQAPLANRMVNIKPVVNSSDSFTITVFNKMVEEDIRAYQDQILAAIGTHFNNANLKMNIVVQEATETVARILTRAQRFELMKEENPALSDLANRLNLELK
ncbi:MAG: DNA polymerase III subunit gamma/tau [Bacteroidaceae bacterium]|nr:DNA polymerase III subunit gamma/tau [Bacteroidaceae bacterium]